MFVDYASNAYKNLINRRWLDIRLTLPKDNDDGGYAKERERLNLMYRRRKNSILPWLQLYFWPIRDRYAQLKQIGHVADVLRYSDAVRVLKTDMHNAKGEDFGSPTNERENLTKLVSILRANKQTVNEFVDQLRDKWYGGA